jgi:hypothetical protein
VRAGRRSIQVWCARVNRRNRAYSAEKRLVPPQSPYSLTDVRAERTAASRCKRTQAAVDTVENCQQPPSWGLGRCIDLWSPPHGGTLGAHEIQPRRPSEYTASAQPSVAAPFSRPRYVAPTRGGVTCPRVLSAASRRAAQEPHADSEPSRREIGSCCARLPRPQRVGARDERQPPGKQFVDNTSVDFAGCAKKSGPVHPMPLEPRVVPPDARVRPKPKVLRGSQETHFPHYQQKCWSMRPRPSSVLHVFHSCVQHCGQLGLLSCNSAVVTL